MDALGELVGESSFVQKLRQEMGQLIRRVGDVKRPPCVLIQGETGTGKGLVASLLHRASARAAGPFVDINCAAIPDTLVEAELFGYERGAFTGAINRKPGLFKKADHGTLFLDEVGSLPMELQAKLLKAIEDRIVRRIGGTESEHFDAWIISATNTDLRAAISQQHFREDLYQRLTVLTTTLPALRERGEDILLLAERFLTHACADYGLPAKTLLPEARAALLAYTWPGNVRELSNVIERAVLLSDDPGITTALLGLQARPRSDSAGNTARPTPSTDAESKRDHLFRALEQNGWNITQTAKQLGLTRPTVRARIKKYDLRPAGERSPERVGQPDSPLPASSASPSRQGLTNRIEPGEARWVLARVALLRLTLRLRRDPGSLFQHAGQLNILLDKARMFGGHVEESGSDGGIVVFGLDPAEDAARRAGQAAVAMQRATRAGWSGASDVAATTVIDVRDLMVDRGQEPPQIALTAKLQAWASLDAWLASAEPDTIIVSASAAGLLRRRFELAPTTGPDQSQAYLMIGSEGAGLGPVGRIGAFVGRHDELELLHSRLTLAVQGHGQVVAVSGEAGIGKSRLLYELRRSFQPGRTACLQSTCLSYGSVKPDLPILEIVQQACEVVETDAPDVMAAKVRQVIRDLGMPLDDTAPYLLHFLGLKTGGNRLAGSSPRAIRGRMMDTVVDLILRQSSRHTLVVMLEDLHWIDRSSEEAVATLVEALDSERVLLLCSYRPGYRPPWLDKSYATQIALPPLSAEDSLTVLRSVLQDDDAVPAPVLESIVARADGNPLFLEELSHSLMERDELELHPGLDVPESIRAVLRARIDRLAPEDRALLESAAVIGKDVQSILLEALTGLPEDSLRRGIGRLQAAELLHQTRHGPQRALTFKHALTHDVAYAGLHPERRKAEHGRVFDAIERQFADRRPEQIDALAFHAVRAEILDKAVDCLREAGTRAYARGALGESLERYEQALKLIPRLPATPENRRRAIDVRLDLHSPLFGLGNVSRVTELHQQAYELASELDDRPRLGCIASRMGNYSWAAARYDEAIEHAQDALAIAVAIDDPEVRVNASHILGMTHLALGQYPKAIDVLKRNVDGPEADFAKRPVGFTIPPYVFGCGLLAWSHAALGDFELAAAYGARGMAEAEHAGHPQAKAATALYHATALMIRGESLAALPLCESGVRLCEADAVRFWRAFGYSMLGWALSSVGRPAEGLPHLERGATLQEGLGIKAILSVFLSRWAEGLLLAGDLEAARQTGARALELAVERREQGFEADALYLLARTAAAGQPPDLDGARGYFECASKLADALGMRPLLARCRLGLARLHRATGAAASAQTEWQAAMVMFREIGMRVWLDEVDG